MRLWMVNQHAYTPDMSAGTRHHATALALQQRGVAVTIIASSFYHKGRREILRWAKGSRTRYSVESGVDYLWVRTPAYYSGSLSRFFSMMTFASRVTRSRNLAAAPKPDVVWATTPSPFAALAGWRLARRYKVPFILEVVDLWPMALCQVGRIPRWHPGVVLLSLLERFLYRHADYIITHLPGALPHLCSRGAKATGTAFIARPIPTEDAPTFLPAAGRPPFLFMYAGAHGQYANLDLLLDAAKRILSLVPPTELRIELLGDGPEKQRLAQRAEEEGIANLEFRDAVPKRAVNAELQRADALIFIAEDVEYYRQHLSPNKIFEYMLAGRPVVLLPDYVNNPVEAAAAGICVPESTAEALSQAMLALLALTPESRRRMGMRGRSYVLANHSLQDWMEEFVAICARLRDHTTVSPPSADN